MKFLERNWPSLLGFWICLVLTAVVVKLVYFSDPIKNVSIEEMIFGIPQADPRLLDYIRKHHIIPPPLSVPYNLREDPHAAKKNLLVIHHITKLLQNQTNGFFVEYRAYDGESLSKTLFLEKYRNWTGLLIEPDSHTFSKLISKRRRAYLSNSCLSPDPGPLTMEFMRRVVYTSTFHHTNQSANNLNNVTSSSNNSSAGSNSSITATAQPLFYIDPANEPTTTRKQTWQKIQVPCFPIYSLVAAINSTRKHVIHYLALDAQGMELQILNNIPWTSLTLKIISVNTRWIPEGLEEVKSFMETRNYWLVAQVYQDCIFAHNSLRRSEANKLLGDFQV